jgi:pimeloyl-ACP methyl ester carboxylesterase
VLRCKLAPEPVVAFLCPRCRPACSTGSPPPGHPGLIKDVQLVMIEGGPHAIPWTHAGQVNTALLGFLRS